MELLQRIKKVKWVESADTTTDDTAILDLLPDPIGDLPTSGMKLSVWDIGIDRRRENEIIRELAKKRERVQYFDYAIFSSALLDDLDISFENTFSTEVKKIGQHHYDIHIPSSEKLLELTKSLILKAVRDRKQKSEIEELLGN